MSEAHVEAVHKLEAIQDGFAHGTEEHDAISVVLDLIDELLEIFSHARCGYCGKMEERGKTDEEERARWRAHARACPRHPMRTVERARYVLGRLVDDLVASYGAPDGSQRISALERERDEALGRLGEISDAVGLGRGRDSNDLVSLVRHDVELAHANATLAAEVTSIRDALAVRVAELERENAGLAQERMLRETAEGMLGLVERALNGEAISGVVRTCPEVDAALRMLAERNRLSERVAELERKLNEAQEKADQFGAQAALHGADLNNASARVAELEVALATARHQALEATLARLPPDDADRERSTRAVLAEICALFPYRVEWAHLVDTVRELRAVRDLALDQVRLIREERDEALRRANRSAAPPVKAPPPADEEDEFCAAIASASVHLPPRAITGPAVRSVRPEVDLGGDDVEPPLPCGAQDVRAAGVAFTAAASERAQGEATPPRPTVVCLCGPLRFMDAFRRLEYEEEMAGRIVVGPSFLPGAKAHDGTTGCTPAQKVDLDELHRRKIDLADEVLVVNVGGYIGESTQSEIDYAIRHHKPLRWLEPDAPHTSVPPSSGRAEEQATVDHHPACDDIGDCAKECSAYERCYSDIKRKYAEMITSCAEPVSAPPTSAPIDLVLADIRAERVRQDEKWGAAVVATIPDGTGAPEDGWRDKALEAKRLTDQATAAGMVTYRHIAMEEVFEAFAERDPARLRVEVIQCAAVFAKWAQGIDTRAAADDGTKFCSTCAGRGRISEDEQCGACAGTGGPADEAALLPAKPTEWVSDRVALAHVDHPPCCQYHGSGGDLSEACRTWPAEPLVQFWCCRCGSVKVAGLDAICPKCAEGATIYAGPDAARWLATPGETLLKEQEARTCATCRRSPDDLLAGSLCERVTDPDVPVPSPCRYWSPKSGGEKAL